MTFISFETLIHEWFTNSHLLLFSFDGFHFNSIFPIFLLFLLTIFSFFSNERRNAEMENLFSYLLRLDFRCLAYGILYVCGWSEVYSYNLTTATYRFIDPCSRSVFHKHDTIICVRVSLIWVRICYGNLDWSTPCTCFDSIKQKSTQKLFCFT